MPMRPSWHSGFRTRRRQLSAALLLCLLAFPLWAQTPQVGDRAPRFRLVDATGSALRFPRDLKEGTSIVLFWASWCPYCKALMPRLAALQREFGTQRLPVLALQLEETGAAPVAAEMAGEFRVFPNAWDGGDAFGVTVLPGLFVIQDGRIRYRLDYPPEDHPSQQLSHGAAQAALLGEWWEMRLRKVLQELVTVPEHPAG